MIVENGSHQKEPKGTALVSIHSDHGADKELKKIHLGCGGASTSSTVMRGTNHGSSDSA